MLSTILFWVAVIYFGTMCVACLFNPSHEMKNHHMWTGFFFLAASLTAKLLVAIDIWIKPIQ